MVYLLQCLPHGTGLASAGSIGPILFSCSSCTISSGVRISGAGDSHWLPPGEGEDSLDGGGNTGMRSSVPFSTHLFNGRNIFMSNPNTILFQMFVSLGLCSEVPSHAEFI